MNANPAPPAAVPVSQPKAATSPHSYNPPLKTPPASAVRSSSASHSHGSSRVKAVLKARPLCAQPSAPGPVPVPGGGVPLNMREVEELERMTKDFIKDMDTHAPVITSAPTGTRDLNALTLTVWRQDPHLLGHK